MFDKLQSFFTPRYHPDTASSKQLEEATGNSGIRKHGIGRFLYKNIPVRIVGKSSDKMSYLNRTSCVKYFQHYAISKFEKELGFKEIFDSYPKLAEVRNSPLTRFFLKHFMQKLPSDIQDAIQPVFAFEKELNDKVTNIIKDVIKENAKTPLSRDAFIEKVKYKVDLLVKQHSGGKDNPIFSMKDQLKTTVNQERLAAIKQQLWECGISLVKDDPDDLMDSRYYDRDKTEQKVIDELLNEIRTLKKSATGQEYHESHVISAPPQGTQRTIPQSEDMRRELRETEAMLRQQGIALQNGDPCVRTPAGQPASAPLSTDEEAKTLALLGKVHGLKLLTEPAYRAKHVQPHKNWLQAEAKAQREKKTDDPIARRPLLEKVVGNIREYLNDEEKKEFIQIDSVLGMMTFLREHWDVVKVDYLFVMKVDPKRTKVDVDRDYALAKISLREAQIESLAEEIMTFKDVESGLEKILAAAASDVTRAKLMKAREVLCKFIVKAGIAQEVLGAVGNIPSMTNILNKHWDELGFHWMELNKNLPEDKHKEASALIKETEIRTLAAFLADRENSAVHSMLQRVIS